jgi:Spy/CpxP family protein refolding chaperone
MRQVYAAAILAAMSIPAVAQHGQHNSSYQGLQHRQIKALDAKQLEDLKAGRGMSLALAAELNGYPGPLHTLELANDLGLTATQRDRVQALFTSMKIEAIPLGERLIHEEAELDRLLASRSITHEALARLTASIGLTQAALRNAHLKFHLATVDVLSPEQVQRYKLLRGYVDQR